MNLAIVGAVGTTLISLSLMSSRTRTRNSSVKLSSLTDSGIISFVKKIFLSWREYSIIAKSSLTCNSYCLKKVLSINAIQHDFISKYYEDLFIKITKKYSILEFNK